jgi:endonuclease/exonuclease/phosphatase family metal-dependent hydrolase
VYLRYLPSALIKHQASSDLILLQEWWFDDKFTTIFDKATSHLFERIAERRPDGSGGMRDDGMCCLVRKKGALELVKSGRVLTGPQRIAQIVQCRERCTNGSAGRNVFIANSHLSFPGDDDARINDKRQAIEAGIILEALTKASHEYELDTTISEHEALEIICGDFNSNSCGGAASLLESSPYNFVNCASATAQQMLTNVGGPVNIGVTHCDHLGNKVSVDHIFLRLKRRLAQTSINGKAKSSSTKKERCAALAFGYLDEKGSRIVNVKRDDILIEGKTVLSDHRPVTAEILWPRVIANETFDSDLYINVTMPLDPLEPAWGIVE